MLPNPYIIFKVFNLPFYVNIYFSIKNNLYLFIKAPTVVLYNINYKHISPKMCVYFKRQVMSRLKSKQAVDCEICLNNSFPSDEYWSQFGACYSM